MRILCYNNNENNIENLCNPHLFLTWNIDHTVYIYIYLYTHFKCEIMAETSILHINRKIVSQNTVANHATPHTLTVCICTVWSEYCITEIMKITSEKCVILMKFRSLCIYKIHLNQYKTQLLKNYIIRSELRQDKFALSRNIAICQQFSR